MDRRPGSSAPSAKFGRRGDDVRQLDNFTDAADQLILFNLDDGSLLQLRFIYRPGISRWMVSVSHPLLTLNNFNVCLGPNILRQWKNLVSFGIAVLSDANVDPTLVTDLQDGAVTVNILSAAEVQAVESEVLVPTSPFAPPGSGLPTITLGGPTITIGEPTVGPPE